MNSVDPAGAVGQSPAALDQLRQFRSELYQCLPRRADELFELTDALLCAEGPVRTLVDLSLAPEHPRGRGALYDGLNSGQVDAERLREQLTRLPLPRMFGRRIVLALEVSPWLRLRRRDLPGPAVLPCLRARAQRRSTGPGLALPGRGCPGEWAHELDGDPGCGAAGPGR